MATFFIKEKAAAEKNLVVFLAPLLTQVRCLWFSQATRLE